MFLWHKKKPGRGLWIWHRLSCLVDYMVSRNRYYVSQHRLKTASLAREGAHRVQRVLGPVRNRHASTRPGAQC